MAQLFSSMTRWFTAFIFLALLAVGGPSFAESEDQLVPGDNIRLSIFENPDLTTEARISARGNIRFPLIGTIRLAGLTPTEASELIASRLKEGNFIRHPQVNLIVMQGQSRQVSVLGQVSRPGRYPIDEAGANLTAILAQAGGVTPAGDDIVTVIRTRDGKTQKLDIDTLKMYRNGDRTADISMENGDTVYVRRAPMFYIYGEIQRAGAYRLDTDTIVMRALSVGGGITVRGTQRGVQIHRRTNDGQLTRVNVALGDQVQADDIIYVSESLF